MLHHDDTSPKTTQSNTGDGSQNGTSAASVHEGLGQRRTIRVGPAKPILKDLEQLEETTQDWVWSNWVPKGVISLVTGDPDAGKTYTLLSLAGIKAQGDPWPDGATCAPGRVLYVDGENGDAELKRRLVAQNITAWNNIRVLSDVDEGGAKVPLSLPGHWPALTSAISTFRPEWVIIDPLVAFHGNDENKATDVRRMLSQFATIAEEHGPAITILQHPNKSVMAPEQYRVRGSLDFIAAPRAVLAVALQDDRETRTLRMLKLNLGPKPQPLAFRIEDGYVGWLGEIATLETQSQLEVAKALLGDLLGCGPFPAEHIRGVAEAEGISYRTVQRAKSDMGVKSVKEGTGPWYWQLPS